MEGKRNQEPQGSCSPCSNSPSWGDTCWLNTCHGPWAATEAGGTSFCPGDTPAHPTHPGVSFCVGLSSAAILSSESLSRSVKVIERNGEKNREEILRAPSPCQMGKQWMRPAKCPLPWGSGLAGAVPEAVHGAPGLTAQAVDAASGVYWFRVLWSERAYAYKGKRKSKLTPSTCCISSAKLL